MKLFLLYCVISVFVQSFGEPDIETFKIDVTATPECETEHACLRLEATKENVKQRKSTQACDEYRRYYTRPAVYGGTEASDLEFPHIVALGFYNPIMQHYRFDCGGSLISPTFVLTAAHCIFNTDMNKLKIVRINALLLPHVVKEMDAQNDFEVKRNITHEDYDGEKKINDIALVELTRSVRFSRKTLPVCLYTKFIEPTETKFAVAGWGSLGFRRKRSPTLQRADVTFVSNEKCGEVYLQLLNLTIEPSHLCAGNGTVNTCDGDSGGPMIVKIYERPFLVGVTAYGYYCGTKWPGVYTRVSSFLDWIEEHVWP